MVQEDPEQKCFVFPFLPHVKIIVDREPAISYTLGPCSMFWLQVSPLRSGESAHSHSRRHSDPGSDGLL